MISESLALLLIHPINGSLLKIAAYVLRFCPKFSSSKDIYSDFSIREYSFKMIRCDFVVS